MADLFKPQGATSFGHYGAQEVAPSGLDHIQEGNPLSAQYKAPGRSSKELVRYLLATQKARYGSTTTMPERILRRHVGLLLKKYQPEVIARSICYAAQLSLYPYSFKFVDKVCAEILVKCPFLMESQTQMPLSQTETES